ncbi:hypothetical protein EXIGLDRAFT_725305 [Exidia glandulosa HHB12029]|uniref:F-box domain-containing protein n=1 Tax=Exidia glandulosa HHB12029 TaxID=1314781 RepID=A0A165MJG0_EXIGL|nr:hypothetical protein EXIGLDRAFT_725305 [Exidia glandulosa HHB12029]
MNAHAQQRNPLRPMPGSDLLRIVEAICALVVDCHVAETRAAAAVTASRFKADRALASIRAAVERAFPDSIHGPSSLDSLPLSILNWTCAYLASGDIRALSRTNRRLRSQSLSYLATLNAGTPPRLFTCGWVHGYRTAYGRRMVSARLHDSGCTSDVADALDSLHDTLGDDIHDLLVEVTWSPTVEPGLLRALSEPATQLETFTLTTSFNNIHDFNQYPSLALDNWHALFADIAPSLTKCSLNGVRLPSASSAAFQTVTCFEYSILRVMETADISRILALMPLLRTLALTATNFQTGTSETASVEGITHNSLRNILLSTWSECSALPWLPQFQFVDNISLVGPTILALESIPYHVPHGACLESVDALVFSRHKACDLETCIRLHLGFVEFPSSLVLQVSAYPLTWLSIGELVWPDGETVMPAMNTLETLVVILAPCFLIGPHSPYTGIFAVAYTSPSAPDTRWEMPRLRELRISSPPLSQDSPHLTHNWQPCLCGSFTVSLHDVSSFIRHCVSFSAPKLDTVVVAGVTVIDYDFAAAWTDLVRLTEEIDIEEGCDTDYARHVPATPGLAGDVEKYFSTL